ncbi:hypothetical protein C5167_011777 [Papaver somniferum]|uniref:uncharacterized protein LOC113342397 n=1 Tax=Papaver somniferum TaxID=3469 RepID=UPI000E6F50EC|nr:uncharacterized protein LOC113342397 [Papaver somniferum]XP_026442744.1 uncharacterized protein LOC113342397 [Papaver somniferum]RZC92696.1 hypothetical protein C5167_011777 [Papaver somniferum]
MGNNNVSGLQEQEKNDVEEPNKSQDVQGKYTGLNSKENLGESDSEKQESDLSEPNEAKIEDPTRLANVPLVSMDTDPGMEIYPSAARTDNPIQNKTSIQEEAEEWMESPADTETSSQEAESTEAESTESEFSPVKPTTEDGNKLELGRNERATESHVIAMNEQILHGLFSTNSEVEKSQDQSLIKEDMELQKGNDEVNMKGGEVEETVIILNDIEESNGEHQPMGLNPFGKESEETQTKSASLTGSVQLFHVKASESNRETETEETKVIENRIKIEGSEIIDKTLQSRESSVEVSEVERMDKYELTKTSTGHKEAEEIEDEESLSHGIKGESQIDGSNVTENGHHVENVTKENSTIELENDSEIFFDFYTPSAAVIDAKVDQEGEKVPISDITTEAGNYDGPEFLSIETTKQLEDFCVSILTSQVNQLTNNLTDSKIGETEFQKPTTESYQEALTTSTDVTTESSFRAENPIANTEDLLVVSSKQDSEHGAFQHRIESTEASKNIESYISESTSDDVKINTEVTKVSSCKLLQSDSENGDFDGIPLLHQEVTQKANTNIRHPSTEKEVEEVEIQEKSVEKQVIALERTSTETLKAPLLNYMKEENHAIESPKKQEKHKPKYSFFGNCMCCTPVSQ